jgi:hypothetical protein
VHEVHNFGCEQSIFTQNILKTSYSVVTWISKKQSVVSKTISLKEILYSISCITNKAVRIVLLVLRGRIHCIMHARSKVELRLFIGTIITSNFENGEITGNNICGAKKIYFAILQLRS